MAYQRSSQKLVKKYDCYAHENSFEERRAVLNEERLSDMLTLEISRIISRKEMCERFASIIRSKLILAAQKQKPRLLLIFEHCGTASHGLHRGQVGIV